MRRNWLIVAVLVLALALIALMVKAKFFAKPGLGALQVASTPKATVFIDGAQIGITPYFDSKITAGEHTVKLVPEPTRDELVSWEGKVQVTANIVTSINRELGSSEAFSSGEIMSLEKIGKRDVASLTVVSVPDKAVVKINGKPEGFAPVSTEDLTPGDYKVTVSSTGYQERTVTAGTVAGYKLTVNIKLAQKIEGIEEEEEESTPSPSPSPEETPEPTPTSPEKPYVKIVSPSIGWLRVRSGPGASYDEITKVDDGTAYPYLEETENGWYKIEYKEGKEGWVSGDYADLVE